MPNFNVNFSPQANQELEKLAEDSDKSKAEVLRQALSLQKWFNETKKSGAKVIVQEKDGSLKEIVPLS